MKEKLRHDLESDLHSDFPNDTLEVTRDKAADRWREACKEDFELFTADVLGFTNADHQKDWCGILGNHENKQIVVAAPRGHSKTTEFSINYPLWEIARNRNVRILLVSAADSQSKSFLREIKGRIERDNAYIDFAGQLQPKKPEKWSDQEIIVDRDRTDLKDPTITTVSVEGTILSKRADIIICDDLLNFENSRTPEARQKIWDWFMLTLLPVLEPKTGRIVVAGTVWQVGDLMMTLLSDPTFDYRKRYQAIIEEPATGSPEEKLWQEWCDLYTAEEEGNKQRAAAFLEEHREQMYANVKVLWPERVGYEELYILRYKDAYAFARAYQNDPASRPSQKIKREWIERALQRGVKLKLQNEPHLKQEYIALTTEGLDLAISQETAADDTCLLTLDKIQYDWEGNKKGAYIIRQIERGKKTPGETRALVTTSFYAMKPHGIRVETVQYQEAMERDLNDSGITIRGHRTGSEKWDSAVGVNSIGLLLEHDMLILPSDPHDARTKDLIGKLVAGMIQFPEGHTDDSLMALWFAVLEMMELTGTQYVMPRVTPDTNEPKPAAPTGTTERAVQEKQADTDLIKLQEGRREYWQREQMRTMDAGAKRAFMRR